MRRVIFHLILSPLIRANYWLRFHRFAPDKWFWADALALSWGYSVKFREAVAKSKRQGAVG